MLVFDQLNFSLGHNYFFLIQMLIIFVINCFLTSSLLLSVWNLFLHCSISLSKKNILQKTIKRTWFDGTNRRLFVFLYFCKHDHFAKIFLYGTSNFSLIAVTLVIYFKILDIYFNVSCETDSAIEVAKYNDSNYFFDSLRRTN